MRRQVRKRVNYCVALAERKRVWKREKEFRTGGNGRFKTPFRRKSHCSKLMVDGKVISDPESLLSAWTGYFKSLSRSRFDEERASGYLGGRISQE